MVVPLLFALVLVQRHSAPLTRLLEEHRMLRESCPKSANDFEALALVMQHGVTFDNSQLVHALCMASVMLRIDSPWLAPATYNRMLLTVGQRQQLGAQMNDRERHQFGFPNLEEMRDAMSETR